MSTPSAILGLDGRTVVSLDLTKAPDMRGADQFKYVIRAANELRGQILEWVPDHPARMQALLALDRVMLSCVAAYRIPL